MKKNVQLVLLLLCVSSILQAQEKEYDDIKKNGIYTEIFPVRITEELGNISINYERIIGKKRRTSIRIAIYPNFNDFITFPITITRFSNPLDKHHFEYGAGMAFLIVECCDRWWSEAPFIMVPLMYRYQKAEGLFFRGGINVQMGLFGFVPVPSISVGYKF